jgi:Ser/Thr protein kinase RdoA (MazF antagonist)
MTVPIAADLLAIAHQFVPPGSITQIQPLGTGNINDTFLVSLHPTSPMPSGQSHWVLQRINTQVFPQPQLVMQNLRTVTEHVHQRLQQAPGDRRWEIPRIIPTLSGQDHWRDSSQSFWRGISFIAEAQSFDQIQSLPQAQEVGYALGMFHNLISDLPATTLADTLPGFHITPRYLQHYEQTRAGAHPSHSPEVDHCLDFIEQRRAFASILEQAKEDGKLPLRLMHGDPKINNVMFDQHSGQAVSLVDLDTVKPGLVHYDIGDCLRSACNPAGEETPHWQTVQFEPELCRGILQGYLTVAHRFLTEADYAYLFESMRLLAFELGLRFFTDYLAGNVYFKVNHESHNLTRALVQFQLTASIEVQESTLRTIIRDLR